MKTAEVVQRRKSTPGLVTKLKEKLTIANEAIVAQDESLNQRRRELLQAISEKIDLQRKLDLEREERKMTVTELQQRFCRLQYDHVALEEVNRQNFDKAHRNSNVAAVMACILAGTNRSVSEMMLLITETAEQMGISLNIANARDSLKRGYTARVDQVVAHMNVGSFPVHDDTSAIE
jgi:hypothetical protein